MNYVLSLLNAEILRLEKEISDESICTTFKGTLSAKEARKIIKSNKKFIADIHKAVKILNDLSDKRSELLRFSKYLSKHSLMSNKTIIQEKYVDEYLENLSDSSEAN